MSKPVQYIVKSVISVEHVAEFDKWYHEKHIPELTEMSGCSSARRFKAVEAEDKFIYMAVYEFKDMETFQRYQQSDAKQYLVGDFREKFGDRAELKTSVWEQIHP